MKIEQISFEPPYMESDFTLSDKKVQGAYVGKKEDALLIVSSSRYKLESGKQKVYVLEGNGHFKWKRGEKDFEAGQAFLMDEVGEYELNGKGKYLIIL